MSPRDPARSCAGTVVVLYLAQRFRRAAGPSSRLFLAPAPSVRGGRHRPVPVALPRAELSIDPDEGPDDFDQPTDARSPERRAPETLNRGDPSGPFFQR